MTGKPIFISDIIREVVESTINSKPIKRDQRVMIKVLQANEQQALGATSIETLDFQTGHKMELIETLKQMGESSYKTKKYPLIYLVQDLPEDRSGKSNLYATATCQIIIAHQTVNTYKITDREEKVFKPVLYPLYAQFMKMLSKHPLINVEQEDTIKHRKINRYYWGRESVGGNDKTYLNDYVDAIELQNVILNINFKIC